MFVFDEWLAALNIYEAIFVIFGSTFAVFGTIYGAIEGAPMIAKKMKGIESRKEKYPIPMNLTDFMSRLRDLKNYGALSKKEYSYLNKLFKNKRSYDSLVTMMTVAEYPLDIKKTIKKLNELSDKSSTVDMLKFTANFIYSERQNKNKGSGTDAMKYVNRSFFGDEKMNFFGIIGINFNIYVDSYHEDGGYVSVNFCYERHNNGFCDKCTFLLTDIDFNNHKEEYFTLVEFSEKIYELEKDLDEYIESNKNPDKEVIALMKNKIVEGEKSGHALLDQIRGFSGIEAEYKDSEQTVELFNKTHMTNFDY